MRIALIDGSPKAKDSFSGELLSDVDGYLGERAKTVRLRLNSDAARDAAAREIDSADVWIIACPLYWDGLPSRLLSYLVGLEEQRERYSQKRIYGVVNCGFYEGIQTEHALRVLENWCLRMGFEWCGGVGVGGGNGLSMMPKLGFGRGPRGPIDKALCALADSAAAGEGMENEYVSPAIPRLLYKLCAQAFWRRLIRGNGGKTRELWRAPGEQGEVR